MIDMIKLPNQSNYPKFIYFGPERYKVKFVKMDDYGETDPVMKEIRIKKDISPRETMSTFIHELLHVVEFEADIPIKHKTIHRLEKALFELLVDNFL
jgi:hypothetical protein